MPFANREFELPGEIDHVTEEADAAVGEVKRMFVLSTVRRIGLGRALMERLLADAPRMDYRAIRLGTLQEMTAAHALYRRLGFVQIPRAVSATPDRVS